MRNRLNISKPTILILADGLPAGGTERQIVELLKGLKSYDDILTAVGILVKKNTAREQEALEFADYVLPIRQRKSLDITMAFSLIGLIKRHKIDLIHTFGSISDFCGTVSGKFTKTPLINGSIRNARPKLNSRDRLSKLCMRFADKIVANSEAGLKTFGCENWKTACVIRNGVDLSRFKTVDITSKKKTSICMVGNFTKKKDQASLIKALPYIRRKFPDVNLVLVGRGKNLLKCKSLVEKMQLSEHVSFTSDCNTPESIIGSCSAGILLSPGGEGISNVILEYMAMKLPVVATDLGGNREVVENGVTGLLVSDHRPEVVSEAICELLNSPERSLQMGQKGREKVINGFGLERMVNDYRALYQDVLKNI